MKARIALTCMTAMLFWAGVETRAEIDRPVVLDRDGGVLPIQEESDILAFLRGAKVIGSRPVGEGITEALRLDLQQGDIRARAIFHHIQVEETKIRRMPNGRTRGYRRDHYTSQIAAYEIGRMLEMSNIPPTVARHVEGLDGSVQLWIEKAMTELQRQEKGIDPPDWTRWNQLYADMRIFDNLINNIDRNLGNMLIDSQGQLWLIDHTRSFGQDKTIPHPEAITRCSVPLYEALKSLDEAAVEKKMKSMKLLSRGEITALFSRRAELLDKIEDRIRLLGRDKVLFHYGDPEPGIVIHEDAG